MATENFGILTDYLDPTRRVLKERCNRYKKVASRLVFLSTEEDPCSSEHPEGYEDGAPGGQRQVLGNSKQTDTYLRSQMASHFLDKNC